MTDPDRAAATRDRQVRADLAERRQAGLRTRHAARLAHITAALPDALRLLRARITHLVGQVAADPATAAEVAEQIRSETVVLVVQGPDAYRAHVAVTATNTEITTTEKETNQ